MSKELLPMRADLDHLQRLAKMFVASGLFADTRDLAQACVKILAGEEIGVPPLAAMTGIHLIKNKVSYSAFLMASVAGKAGYRFTYPEHSEKRCVLHVFRGTEKVGESSFSFEDAARAGLTSNDTYKKYPKNMLWARAMSNACKWYCSDAFAGSTPYTPDELGATVNPETLEVESVTNVEPLPELPSASASADDLNSLLTEEVTA